jgi:hypothetical protein
MSRQEIQLLLKGEERSDDFASWGEVAVPFQGFKTVIHSELRVSSNNKNTK